MKHIDDNLTDLHILSLLPEGVKVSVRHGRLVHEKPKTGEGVMAVLSYSMHSLRRWYNNDSRVSGMNEIFSIVQNSLKIIEDADEHYITQYMKVFPRVVDGIQNYRRTYKDDAFITSRCSLLIERIHYVISKHKKKDE